MLLKGLTSKQAEELLKKHGENTIIEQKKKSLLMKFFEQFNNVFTIILLVAAILSFIIGEPIDGTWVSFMGMLRGGFYKHTELPMKFYNLPTDPPEDRHKWFYGVHEA